MREGHSLAIEDLDEVLDELPARLVLASARGIARRARVSWLTRWSSRVLVEATDIQPVAERAGVALPEGLATASGESRSRRPD